MARAVPAPSPASLRKDLLSWFDREKRDLPWRRTRDPYAIWLSEVMLQQTQVSVVIPFWERFLEQLPTVTALAAADEQEVFALWRGLGYYSRARNLHRAAKAIVEQHRGALPSTAEALLELPGFGRYTAGAVASIAFGQCAPLVDGNVARVFSRLFAIDGAPGDRAREAELWRTAELLVDPDRPGDWNQALMELGATVCKPESPLCLLCPAQRHCRALAQGRVDELPPPKARAKRKSLALEVAVLRRKDALLLARRHGRGLFGGLWELPCAEVDNGDAGAALARTLPGLTIGESVGTVRRTLTHRDLELRLFEVRGRAPKSLPGYAELRFVSPDELETLGISTAMQRALAAIPARS